MSPETGVPKVMGVALAPSIPVVVSWLCASAPDKLYHKAYKTAE